MRKIKKVHFIGIGGSGMNGIAEVMLGLSYKVTGSDLVSSAVIERLTQLGATIHLGHKAELVKDVDVIVYSSAISSDNVELRYARQQNITAIPRAEMLAEIMRFRHSIAVAGMHGKTTTTSLIASTMAANGLDPTFVIGGKLLSAETNAKLGAGKYMVVEADESDASFLQLRPISVVVTNIEEEHMSFYNNDFSAVQRAFLQFINNIPFYGLAVLCADCEEVRNLLPKVTRPFVTYGFTDRADYQIVEFRQQALLSEFKFKVSEREYTVRLNMPGRHNALNALATIIINEEQGVAIEDSIQALAAFKGVGRRFELKAEYKVVHNMSPVRLIDDYGHHPSEIDATLASARAAWPGSRIVLIFQPHRYSRTRDLLKEFVKTLAQADVLILLDIYSAGEAPIEGISSQALLEMVRKFRGTSTRDNLLYLSSEYNLLHKLPTLVHPNDTIIIQGAGNIGSMVPGVMQAVQAMELSQVEFA